MKKFKLILISINLWLYSLVLLIYKKALSVLFKRKAPLSARVIVKLSKQYECMLNSWSNKEVKFILSVLRLVRK